MFDFGLYTQVSNSGPHGRLVLSLLKFIFFTVEDQNLDVVFDACFKEVQLLFPQMEMLGSSTEPLC